MKATFLVPYPLERAPGQRFRFEQWLRLLPEGRVEARIRPLFDEAAYAALYRSGGTAMKAARTTAALARRIRDVVSARDSDVVFVYRELFAFGPPVLEALLERRVPLVYDFDDAIYLGDTSPANARWARLKAPEKVKRIVAGAAMTTVGNDHLADYARRFSPRVRVIPTTLDVGQYRPPDRPSPPPERLRVGWSGSATTSRHLHLIDGALRRMADLNVDLVVHGDPGFRVPGAPEVTALPWRRECEIADVGAFDVGLMPLADDEWSRGKCGFKALLYMALGIPAVVSPVGVNREIVTHGENGLWANSEDEWVDAVAMLAGDATLRHRLAVAGRQTVVECYSGQRWAPVFAEVLEQAVTTQR